MAKITFTESYVKTQHTLALERVQEDLVRGTSFFTYLKDVHRLESIKRKCADTLSRKRVCASNKNTRFSRKYSKAILCQLYCILNHVFIHVLFPFHISAAIQFCTSASVYVCKKHYQMLDLTVQNNYYLTNCVE